MSGIPYQSKLLLYRDFIKEARKKNVSYRKIADLLKEKFNVECYPNTVFSFVKARANKKPVFTLPEEFEKESPQPLKTKKTEKTAKRQKPLTKSPFSKDAENTDNELWTAVNKRAGTNHSKRLVIRKNEKLEDINE